MPEVDIGALRAVASHLDAAGLNYAFTCVCLIQAFRSLLAEDEFMEALPGYLPPDSASQARLPLLREKLDQITQLSD